MQAVYVPKTREEIIGKGLQDTFLQTFSALRKHLETVQLAKALMFFMFLPDGWLQEYVLATCLTEVYCFEKLAGGSLVQGRSVNYSLTLIILIRRMQVTLAICNFYWF